MGIAAAVATIKAAALAVAGGTGSVSRAGTAHRPGPSAPEQTILLGQEFDKKERPRNPK